MEIQEILNELEGLSDPANLEGMGRFGINTENTMGIKVTSL